MFLTKFWCKIGATTLTIVINSVHFQLYAAYLCWLRSQIKLLVEQQHHWGEYGMTFPSSSYWKRNSVHSTIRFWSSWENTNKKKGFSSNHGASFVYKNHNSALKLGSWKGCHRNGNLHSFLPVSFSLKMMRACKVYFSFTEIIQYEMFIMKVEGAEKGLL